MGIRERISRIRASSSSAWRRVLYDVGIGGGVAGIGAVAVWSWNRVMKYLLLTAPLSTSDISLVSAVAASLLVAAVSVTWAIIATRRRSAPPTIAAPDSVSIARLDATPPQLLPVPHLPAPPSVELSPDPRAKRLNSNEWLIEVHEVLYRQRVGSLFAVNGWYILVNMSLTNKVADEPTVTYWRLDLTVGSSGMSTSKSAGTTDLPPNWYIERDDPFSVDSSKMEEIERPTLDKILAREGLLKGKRRSGWVLFEMDAPRRSAGPHNAALLFLIHDALGVVHRHEEAVFFYEATGEIKIAQESPAS